MSEHHGDNDMAKTHHSNKRIISQTYEGAHKRNTRKMSVKMNAHVSQRMGNSLCSHPALLISAFGGILTTLQGGKQEFRERLVEVNS
jgi:hypothetical protein